MPTFDQWMQIISVVVQGVIAGALVTALVQMINLKNERLQFHQDQIKALEKSQAPETAKQVGQFKNAMETLSAELNKKPAEIEEAKKQSRKVGLMEGFIESFSAVKAFQNETSKLVPMSDLMRLDKATPVIMTLNDVNAYLINQIRKVGEGHQPDFKYLMEWKRETQKATEDHPEPPNS